MDSKSGKLILAGADMMDPNFAQTVTLIVEHTGEGALGLVLNRPSKTLVTEAWRRVEDGPCLVEGWVHQGGPCPGPLMVLHDAERQAQIDVVVGEGERIGVSFTADADDIRELMASPPDRVRCFAGYAGWGAGQLDDELERSSWIVTDATAEAIFDSGADLWKRLLRKINPAQAALLDNPGIVPQDPSMN
ncbi:MAG: YqgE/AlgH family protein [Planctomycetota bacterium]